MNENEVITQYHNNLRYKSAATDKTDLLSTLD